VAELRSYSGSRQGIERLYQGATVMNPLNGTRQPVELAFYERGSLSNAGSLPEECADAAERRFLRDAPGAIGYVVFVFYCDSAGFDYRCN
jgi:hypothetical protein